MAGFFGCRSLSPLLQPTVINISEYNASDGNYSSDEVRINTCFEDTLVQVFLLAAIVLISFGYICSKWEQPMPLKIESAKSLKAARKCIVCLNLFFLLGLVATSGVLIVFDVMNGVFGSNSTEAFALNDGTANGDGKNVGIADVCEIILWLYLLILFISDMKRVRKFGSADGQRFLIPALPSAVRLLLIVKMIVLVVRTRLAFQRIIGLYFKELLPDWEKVGNFDGQENIAGSGLRVVRALFCVIFVGCGLFQRTMELSGFDPRAVEVKDDDEDGDEIQSKDAHKLDERQSREQGSSICEQITFSWVVRLLQAGSMNPLQIEQIFLMRTDQGPIQTADKLGSRWEARIAKERAKIAENKKLEGAGAKSPKIQLGQFALLTEVFGYCRWEIFASGILAFLSMATQLVQPLILNSLLNFIATPIGPANPAWLGYGLVFVLVVVQFLQNILQTQFYWLLAQTGFMIRGALSVMIFRKALRLTQPEMAQIGVGKIVNLMEVDCMKIMWGMYVIHQIWALPLTLVLGILMLFAYVKWAAFSGIGVFILLLPLNFFFMRKFIATIGKIFALADVRVRFLTEQLQGIQLIKLLGWEAHKYLEVFKRRIKEVNNRWWLRFWLLFVMLLALATPLLINICTFGVILVQAKGVPLTAATGYTVLTLTGIVQGPISGFGRVLSVVSDILTAVKRIQAFLLAEQTEEILLIAGNAMKEIEDHPTGYFHSQCDSTRKQESNISSEKNKQSSSVGTPVAVSIKDMTVRWGEVKEKDQKLLKSAGKNAHAFTKKKGTSKDNSNKKGANSASKKTAKRNMKNNKALSQPLLDPTADVVDDGTKDGDSESKGPALPTLAGVNLSIPAGSLVMVIGKVGSGKTTLLASMINEIPIERGQVCMNGSVAYCSQLPWIQNMSLRDNILFGREFDRDLYKDALTAAELWQDLESLPNGDATEIGERGLNLSRGQQHRVALARAVYSQAQVYLLDDVLSAVDASTGSALMEKCITGTLKNKTRILVTHSLHWLQKADLIIVMEDTLPKQESNKGGEGHTSVDNANQDQASHSDTDGTQVEDATCAGQMDAQRTCVARVAMKGTFKELLDRGFELDEYVEGGVDDKDGITNEDDGDQTVPPAPASGIPLVRQKTQDKDGITNEDDGDQTVPPAPASGIPLVRQKTQVEDFGRDGKTRKDGGKAAKLIKKEERQVGVVKFAVWYKFFQSWGWGYTFWMLIFLALQYLSDQLFSWWMSFWTDAAQEKSQPFSQTFYFLVFAGLNIAPLVFNLSWNWLRQQAAWQQSLRIHNDALWGVLRAPMSYFDTTKTGRIINRFSSDMAKVDSQLAYDPIQFVGTLVQAAFSFVMIAIAAPVAILAVIPALVFYYCLQKTYRASARELQRLASISRSPVFAAFTETLNGIQTVRAFREVERFERDNEKKLILNISCYLNQRAVQMWLGLRLNWITTGIVLIVALFCVIQHQLKFSISVLSAGENLLTAGITGLALSKTLEVATVLESLINTFTSAETSLVAMERLMTFANLQSEPALKQAYDKQIVNRAASSASPRQVVSHQVESKLNEDARDIDEDQLDTAKKTTEEALDDLLFQGTIHTFPAELRPLVQSIVSGETISTQEQAPVFPLRGEVEFRNVVMAYRPTLPPTLKGISFTIPGGQSVGICGRTGAGKSSLLVALFRLVRLETDAIVGDVALQIGSAKQSQHVPANGSNVEKKESIEAETVINSGTILIDGEDISKMGLHFLRKCLSIIPQDPVLFSGTLRSNLDPWGRFGNKKIWSVLDSVELSAFVKSQDKKLLMPIAGKGENLSVGQRQLVCLARALLRESKILVLDEATAAVDMKTDDVIQRTLQQECRERRCTVLTIAHRMNTIMNNDLVLLMDDGRVGEFGSMRELIRNPESKVHALAVSQGITLSE